MKIVIDGTETVRDVIEAKDFTTAIKKFLSKYPAVKTITAVQTLEEFNNAKVVPNGVFLVDGDKDKNSKCQKCKKKNALELHSCPYRSDVNNDNKFVCNCCRSCQTDCAQDV